MQTTNLEKYRIAFGKNLKRLRKRRKVSQRALAQTVGVHFTTISHYERGVGEPSAFVLGLIAKALDVSADELVFGKKG